MAMLSGPDIVYLGLKSHSIKRSRLLIDNSADKLTLEVIDELDPIHNDIVTNLVWMKNSIVSVSKDKTLKLWDVNGPCDDNITTKPFLKTQIINPHQQDNVSCLLGSKHCESVLSLGNNGIIKNWHYNDDRLVCKDSLVGSQVSFLFLKTQSVIDSTCWADESNLSFLVSTGTKKIRLFTKQNSMDNTIENT